MLIFFILFTIWGHSNKNTMLFEVVDLSMFTKFNIIINKKSFMHKQQSDGNLQMLELLYNLPFKQLLQTDDIKARTNGTL